MKKILIIGYFGYNTNQLDGQTVKTRNIYKLLKEKSHNVDYFDSQDVRYSKGSLVRLIWQILICKNLIIIPASNMLKLLFPIVFILSKLFNKNVVFIPVGGWLSRYIEDKRAIRLMLSHIRVILPQTYNEVNDLRNKYGFKNVEYFPNFRLSDFVPDIIIHEKNLRLVFFSRIHKMKGLDVVFYIADRIQEDQLSEKITIDFYGQINEPDKEYFMNNIAKYDFVNYKGVIEPQNINKTLTNYDILLFPTRYINDEGFPGTILDGYMSGVPVIASNWCHSKEFINNDYCGFICNIDNLDEFYNKIIYLFNNKEMLLQMKKNAFLQSKEYSGENAYKSIFSFLI